MNRCIKWLIGICRDKTDIRSQDVNKMGEESGYTKQMIGSARRRAGIKSILKGGEYYFIMPTSSKILMGGN